MLNWINVKELKELGLEEKKALDYAEEEQDLSKEK